MLLSDGLLSTARKRLDPTASLTEVDLRRCISDLYYALFHTLCETLASVVHGDEALPATREAYSRLYRLADHNAVAKACDDDRLRDLGREFENFAAQFKAMKLQREIADYDGLARFEVSKARTMLDLIDTCISDFRRAPADRQLKFAVLVSVRKRSS